MDNRFEVEGTTDKISSHMLVTKFGGATGLGESLFTNLKVSSVSFEWNEMHDVCMLVMFEN